MSRAATATPPPPYFPQRTSTPTMRHCAAPTVSAAHFAPRPNQHQHAQQSQYANSSTSYPSSNNHSTHGHHGHQSPSHPGVTSANGANGDKMQRRIKHLPSSLSGLKGRKEWKSAPAGDSVARKSKGDGKERVRGGSPPLTSPSRASSSASLDASIQSIPSFTSIASAEQQERHGGEYVDYRQEPSNRSNRADSVPSISSTVSTYTSGPPTSLNTPASSEDQSFVAQQAEYPARSRIPTDVGTPASGGNGVDSALQLALGTNLEPTSFSSYPKEPSAGHMSAGVVDSEMQVDQQAAIPEDVQTTNIGTSPVGQSPNSSKTSWVNHFGFSKAAKAAFSTGFALSYTPFSGGAATNTQAGNGAANGVESVETGNGEPSLSTVEKVEKKKKWANLHEPSTLVMPNRIVSTLSNQADSMPVLVDREMIEYELEVNNEPPPRPQIHHSKSKGKSKARLGVRTGLLAPTVKDGQDDLSRSLPSLHIQEQWPPLHVRPDWPSSGSTPSTQPDASSSTSAPASNHADSTAHFAPTAPILEPPPDVLVGLSEKQVLQVKREWAENGHRRLNECARLCSQWPMSGYNVSKWGPNGAKNYYEPQSYCNPQHVAVVMSQQSDLERWMCENNALFYPSRKSSGSGGDNGADAASRSSSDSSFRSSNLYGSDSLDTSSAPSPTISTAPSSIARSMVNIPAYQDADESAEKVLLSVSDKTAEDIRLAMASPLIDPAPSAVPTASEFSFESKIKPSPFPESGGKSLKAAKSMSELYKLASSNKTAEPAEMGQFEEDVDMTASEPCLSASPYTGMSGVASAENANPARLRPPTRPVRAQSCGSKRPLVQTGVSSGVEEEKRRRVDEAMVIEEAVSTGVIMPSTSPIARHLCPPSPSTATASNASFQAQGARHGHGGGLPRLCTSTPDLASARQTEPANDAGQIPAAAVFGHVVKTSDTHPIIVSPFFPDELLPILAQHMVIASTPASRATGITGSESGVLADRAKDTRDRKIFQMSSSIDVPSLLLSFQPPIPSSFGYDGMKRPGSICSTSSTPALVPSPTSGHFPFSLPLPSTSSSSSVYDHRNRSRSSTASYSSDSSRSSAGSVSPKLGNLLLSSCPGKRLRMEGPVKGRGPVCRDLKTDLGRIKAEGVGSLVCCLDDAELALLGVPWETYREVAAETGLDVIRLPMPDGFTPVSIALFDSQVTMIVSKYTLQGINVLIHCRGGVGRAGLTACAWAIKMGYVQPHPSLALVEDAARRQSIKAAAAALSGTAAATQAPAPAPGASGKSSFGANLFQAASSTVFGFGRSSSSTLATTAAPPTAATAPNTTPSPGIPAELEHQIVMSITERVIAMIRSRRGLKAIESFEQVQFLAAYVRWCRAAGNMQ